MSTDETDDGPDDGPDEAETPGAEGPAGVTAEGAGRKRRRRRRRRHGEGPATPEGQAASGPPPAEGAVRPVRQWQGGTPTAADARVPSERVESQPVEGAASSEPSSQGPSSQGPSSQGPSSQGPSSQGPSSQGPSSQGPSSQRADGRNERGRRRRGGREREDRGPRDGGAPRDAASGDVAYAAPAEGTAPGSDAPGSDPRGPAPRDARGGDQRGRDQRGRDNRGGEKPGGGDNRSGQQRGGDQRGRDNRGGEQRGGEQRGGEQRGGEQRGGEQRSGEQRGRENRGGDNRGGAQRGRDQRGGAAAGTDVAAAAARTYEAPTPRLEQQQRRPAPASDDDHLETTSEVPAVAWGTDEDGPPPVVTLAPDLPAEAPPDDLDPLTYPLLDAASAQLGDDIASVIGVRFMPGGRIQWCDAADADYAVGERVIVDSDRGQRLATVASPPTRRATRDRGLRRVIRRANDNDLRGERSGDEDRAKALRVAKDAAAALRLPLKVFRVEMHGAPGRGAKLNVYYTSDERLDLREFIRDVGNGTGARIELRQLGVRDEAKAVGGIGSCGLTLCCTTWLPDFVPVSIKMAKDQGLVLSPTKVSGQCGRLKCCLVYEQAAYAELRKGLPKLGKRVISARGEGRVVEVDVLRQRLRVSYGMGDTEVLPATEVKPLFPPGNQPQRARGDEAAASDHDDAPDEDVPPIEDPILAPPDEEDHGPTDDPSSDDYQP